MGRRVSWSVAKASSETRFRSCVHSLGGKGDGQIQVQVGMVTVPGVESPRIKVYGFVKKAFLHQSKTVVHKASTTSWTVFADVTPQGFLGVPTSCADRCPRSGG